MCGIVGVLMAKGNPAVQTLYDALLALQHRGQDAAGIVTEDDGRLCLRKDNGMVRDVFTQEAVVKLTGDRGIGHVRYPTAGSSCSAEAQPFYVNSPFGIVLAHNGNLINVGDLKAELLSEWRHLNTGSDSEVLLNIFAAALLERLTERASNRGSPVQLESREPAGAEPRSYGGPGTISSANDSDVLSASRVVMRRCVGGYAVVAMITGWGIVALRDPHGIRPLVYGRRATLDPSGKPSSEWEYMVASESGALNALGYDLVDDVAPGHAVFLRHGYPPAIHDCLPQTVPRPPTAPCLFEYVYFARPDSILDGISVYRTRLRMGDKLAKRIQAVWTDHDIDVVIPVPDTSRTAALECAATLGIMYREGFIKNRYIGRTFIMPQQGLRKKSVRQKLAPIHSEFKGRNVLLVDDSIVRGTTCGEIVSMAREAGARKVYIASAAPPVRFPNVYGIDMPTKEELVASCTASDAPLLELEQKVTEIIGADRVIYQELHDLTASVMEEAADSHAMTGLDSSCFDGRYVTEAINDEYLAKLAKVRNSKREGNATAFNNMDTLEIPAKKTRER